MENLDTSKKHMFSDTIIYLIAKLIEGVVGIFIVSRYTYYFSEIAYGRYITLNTTIQIVAAFSMLWLSQSMYRFFKEYEEKNKLTQFYTTSFFIWLGVNLIVSSLALTLLIVVNANSTLPLNFEVYIWAIIAFIAYNTQTTLTTTLASSRKTKFNLILSMCSAFGKFFLVILLVYVYEANVVVIFITNATIDTFVSVLAFLRLKIYKYIKIRSLSQRVFKRFIVYGTPFLGSILTTTLINNSDRYIISVEDVAIYVTNYSLVSTLYTMLNTGISRGSVPTIYNVYTKGNKDEAYSLVSQLVKYYLILIVPLNFGIALISKELSTLLFAPSYKEAHFVMVFVSIALTFSFLTECSNKVFELKGETKYIFRYSLIGGLLNFVLNLLFIPKYGYVVACFTTVIGYLTYFLLSKRKSMEYNKWSLGKSFYIKVFGISTLMFIFVSILKTFLGSSLISTIFYVVVAIVFYIVFAYYTGLIKEEVNTVLNALRKKGEQK
ncbi:MAG: lipopolysaccharide biosynthesis protein [Lachnospirales bacterium]